jgi:hypothetical protein
VGTARTRYQRKCNYPVKENRNDTKRSKTFRFCIQQNSAIGVYKTRKYNVPFTQISNNILPFYHYRLIVKIIWMSKYEYTIYLLQTRVSIWHISRYSIVYGSRDSAVGIATGYGLDDRWVGVRVPVGSRIFSSPRRPGVHPTSYVMGTGSSFLGVKAARAWSWPLTSS